MYHFSAMTTHTLYETNEFFFNANLFRSYHWKEKKGSLSNDPDVSTSFKRHRFSYQLWDYTYKYRTIHSSVYKLLQVSSFFFFSKQPYICNFMVELRYQLNLCMSIVSNKMVSLNWQIDHQGIVFFSFCDKNENTWEELIMSYMYYQKNDSIRRIEIYRSTRLVDRKVNIRTIWFDYKASKDIIHMYDVTFLQDQT
jgi:hypothetical protein